MSRYCLERHPTVFPQRGRQVEWFFYYTRTRTRTLCLEKRAYAVIERVYTCPKEIALYNSLTYYLQHEEDGEDRRKLCSFATATDTIWNRSRRICRVGKLHGKCRHLIRHSRFARCLPLQQTRLGKASTPSLVATFCYTSIYHRLPWTSTQQCCRLGRDYWDHSVINVDKSSHNLWSRKFFRHASSHPTWNDWFRKLDTI